MSLLAKRRVTYTVSPEPDVLAALNDYEALGDKPPADKEAAAAWKAERAQLLQVLEASRVLEYRFTLSTVTVAGQGRYNAAMRRFATWHKAQYGVTPLEALTEANKAPDADTSQETITLWNASIAWASIWSALSAVETRSRPILADDAPWAEAEGVDWADYATFEATVPGDLAIALAQAAEALNPGLWSVNGDGGDDDRVKKRGGIRGSGYALH